MYTRKIANTCNVSIKVFHFILQFQNLDFTNPCALAVKRLNTTTFKLSWFVKMALNSQKTYQCHWLATARVVRLKQLIFLLWNRMESKQLASKQLASKRLGSKLSGSKPDWNTAVRLVKWCWWCYFLLFMNALYFKFWEFTMLFAFMCF